MLPIWGAAEAAASSADAAIVTREKLLNVLISGPVLIVAFKQSEAALRRQVTRREP